MALCTLAFSGRNVQEADMASKQDLWGRQLTQSFFKNGGFKQPNAVSWFKEQFLILLENSPIETRDLRQQLDLIALGSLALIEARANDYEIDILLLFIGRLEEEPFEVPTHWFAHFLIELIKIKHAYKRHTSWFAAESLDSVVADCVKNAFENSIDIADGSRFLEDLDKQNLERFGNAIDLSSLNGLKGFLQTLRDDGSCAAGYLLLLLRLEQPDLPSIIETLGDLTDDSTPLSQLATFHLATVFDQNNCTEDAARMFQSVLHDFQGGDLETTITSIYCDLRKRAENSLERLRLNNRIKPISPINIKELVEEQIYRIEQCVSEVKDVAQLGSAVMLPTRLSSLAVETGKLAEAFWKCCLVSHIQNRRRAPPVKHIVINAIQNAGTNAQQTSAGLVLSIQKILGNRTHSGEDFRKQLLGLIEAWEPSPDCVIDFLNRKYKQKTRPEIIEALFISAHKTMRETKADYPTLVLANIFAAAFSSAHPLSRIETSKGKGLISASQNAFKLRNDHAHYSIHGENFSRFQLDAVLRSSGDLIDRIEGLGEIS
jgi:hypothetical protein